MLAGTISDRILEALRLSSQPLDDDQLSERAEIGSWQQVNRICRQLEQYGRIRRIVGPDQRIVNEFIQPALGGVALDSPEPAVVGAVLGSTEPSVLGATLGEAAPSFGWGSPELMALATGRAEPIIPAAIRAAPAEPAPGGAVSRRTIERAMLDLLGERLGVALAPVRIAAASGAHVEIDGADAGRSVLVACWTQQGTPTAEQEHRLLADTLKLSWIAAAFQPRPRLVLCFGDQRAAEPFLPSGSSWAGHALSDLGMTVVVLDLPAGIRGRMRASRRLHPPARRDGDR
jgi:hypothetical protein